MSFHWLSLNIFGITYCVYHLFKKMKKTNKPGLLHMVYLQTAPMKTCRLSLSPSFSKCPRARRTGQAPLQQQQGGPSNAASPSLSLPLSSAFFSSLKVVEAAFCKKPSQQHRNAGLAHPSCQHSSSGHHKGKQRHYTQVRRHSAWSLEGPGSHQCWSC